MEHLSRQQQAKIQADDVKILQKVNSVHRQVFGERFPGQIEHCLRLTMERLQYGLDKRGKFDITDIETWILMPAEIKDLAEAAYYLDQIRKGL